MNKNILTIVIVVVVLIIGGILWGVLGRESAENQAETAIEQATGGSADVELDDNTLTVNTDQGSFEVGENVTLPDNFPSDVHVTDGTITGVTTIAENNGFTVSLEATKSAEAVFAEYKSELAADGWTETASISFGTTNSVSGEKDGRIISVSVSEGDGKTIVTVVTSDIE